MHAQGSGGLKGGGRYDENTCLPNTEYLNFVFAKKKGIVNQHGTNKFILSLQHIKNKKCLQYIESVS